MTNLVALGLMQTFVLGMVLNLSSSVAVNMVVVMENLLRRHVVVAHALAAVARVVFVRVNRDEVAVILAKLLG
jgi:hypothetical protein